jgi:hypothetical protein
LRYKTKLSIRVKGRLIKATFTLSDRSQKTYPVLLGRRLLKDKFIIDVSLGEPLSSAEKARAKHLKEEIKKLKKDKKAL